MANKTEHWTGMKVPKRTAATELGDVDVGAELRHRAQALANAKTDKARDTALNRLRSSLSSFEKMKEKSPVGKSMDYKARITRKGGGTVKKKAGGTVKKHGGGMTDVGLYPAEEARAGVLSERERSRFAKKGGSVKRKAGGTVKKQVGGLTQGYDARLDESLGARNRGTRGNLAARRHESEGMERALGRRPYSAASTMAKKGGSVKRKKGGTTSRKGGGKIMVGYKSGGRV